MVGILLKEGRRGKTVLDNGLLIGLKRQIERGVSIG